MEAFGNQQKMAAAWLRANRPSEENGPKGTEAYQEAQALKKQAHLSNVRQIVLKYMDEEGITPRVRAIRGGTDGAQLSFMGLPCPNLFAGGLNFHGPHEFLPIPSLEKASELVVKICELTAAHFGQR